MGTAVVKNTSSKPLTDVRVSFIIKQYMDGPKESATIDDLKPGETREVLSMRCSRAPYSRSLNLPR